jgi:hypothetical protein
MDVLDKLQRLTTARLFRDHDEEILRGRATLEALTARIRAAEADDARVSPKPPKPPKPAPRARVRGTL